MTAKELYQEVRRRYPDAAGIFADTSCQNHNEGLLEVWSVSIHDKPFSPDSKQTHSGYGYSPEACLANIKEVCHERHEG